MMPGMGGMNPAMMKRMMKQLGMKSEELKAKKVIIELEDGRLVIEEPNVTSIEVQGKKTYTVMGSERLEKAETGIPEEDIEMVASQTGKAREEAKKALEECSGDLAEAIKKLKD